MIPATGDIGTQWLLDLFNGIVKEGCIPDSRGLEIKCGTANLQRQRQPQGMWILQRD